MKPDTLFNTLYRASFSNKPVPGWSNNAAMRAQLQSAQRFVLDEGMAIMLAEISTAAFKTLHGMTTKGSARERLIEQIRHGARAPFPATWVEYPLRPCMTRIHDLLETNKAVRSDPSEVPETEGWLITQHPGVEAAYLLTVFSRDSELKDRYGFETWTFPVGYAWVTDDTSVIPWRTPFELDAGSASQSEVCTGLPGYITDRVGLAQNPLLVDARTMGKSAVINLLREWVGCLRRVMAFLATLGDIPIAYREVKAAKGFLGGGSIRKYLDHRTITLTIPAEQYNKVARQAVAAARRRAHAVRGHWRIDWRHPLDPLCEHDYAADDKHLTCRRCHGRKSFIQAHQRGDDRLGYVTHDYTVTAREGG
jgi:hypothetical protein